MSFLFLSCIFHNALLAISISWTRSPFMALMFAVLLFINTSIILLMLGFEFLALINMLVYVGALAVLFLFVVMLLEIPSSELRAYYRGWSPLALFGCLGMTKGLFSEWFSINLDLLKEDSIKSVYSIAGYIPTSEVLTFVGHAFYIVYSDVLILNSLILTIALFGALVLANSR